MKTVVALIILLVASSFSTQAQNSNSSSTSPRPRTTNTNKATPTPAPSQRPVDVEKPKTTTTPPKTTQQKPSVSTQAPGSEAVTAAFNNLIEGIRHADVDAVTKVYWNSPRLSLFNFNGSVTKGWEQVKKNRESSYPDLKDVKLEYRDLSVTMLGRDGAVVSCLWTQSDTYKGTPETVSGRMTLVFKRFGTEWKAIHLHTSSDSPNPASVPASEQTTPKPSPTPNR